MPPDHNYGRLETRKAELQKPSALTAYMEANQTQMFKAVCNELQVSYHDLIETFCKDFILDNVDKLSVALRSEIEKDDIIASFYATPSSRPNIAPVNPNKIGFTRWLSDCWTGEEGQSINPDHFNL